MRAVLGLGLHGSLVRFCFMGFASFFVLYKHVSRYFWGSVYQLSFISKELRSIELRASSSGDLAMISYFLD